MIKQTEDERLIWIKNRLRSVAEGASLLDFAEKNGIPIRFDAGLPADNGGRYSTEMSLQNDGSVRAGEKRLDLNPTLSNRKLVTSLGHELRHAYQAAMLGFEKRFYLRPRDFVIFTRLIEGDALAFQGYLERKLRLERTPSVVRRVLDYAESDFQREMEKSFVSFQKNCTALYSYDSASLNFLMQNKAEARTTHPSFFSQKLSEVFNVASALPVASGIPGFLYMGAKTMGELADKIYQHVPGSTREAIELLS